MSPDRDLPEEDERSQTSGRTAGTTGGTPGLDDARWWQAAFEGSRDAIFIADQDARLVAVNPAACELIGYTREELLTRRVSDLHDRVDPAEYRLHHGRALAGESVLTRAALRRKDGGTVQAELSSRAFRAGDRTFVHTAARDVGERARAEEAERRSDARYREILENLNDVVYTVALDGSLTYLSRSVQTLLGYEPGELIGTSYADLVHPDDVERIGTAFKEVLAGVLRPREYRLRARDGEYRWVRTSSRAVAEDGVPVALHGVLTDITDRRTAAEALQESERRFRALFDGAPAGIFTTTTSGRVVSVNRAMAVMLGFSSPEQVVAHYTNLGEQLYVDPSRRGAFIRQLREEGRVEGFEYEAWRLDGTTSWLQMSARIAGEADGGFLVEGFAMDITERKRAEEALRESERRYRSFFQDDLTADCVTLPDGTVIDCNPAFVRIFGYADLDEALATNTRAVYLNAAQRSALLERLVDRGRLEYHELELRRRDGQAVHVIANFVAETGDDGALERIRCYLFDITQRRQLEEQLRQAQKMEAVGRLAGGVAHDFNNLLQALLSLSQLVRSYASDPERLDAVADDLEGHALRGAALTRQLLLFSRRETAKRTRLDVNRVIDDHSKLLQRLVRENIALRIELADEPLLVEGDPGQLEQVIMNLVVNASDVLEHGGSVAIRSGRCDDSSVWISVEDDGPGIDDDVKAKVFEPFFTTKPAGKGTGLGLSVVHGIVVFHGGTIDVEDRDGGGTVFRVVLPPSAAHDADGSVESSGEHRRIDLGNGERVLVVEDESIAREALEELLEALGYEVVAVGSAEEAAAIAGAPGFAVLLTDLMLPGASGVELARRLRDRWPDLAVILMSGYNEDEVVRRDITAGELRFLQKPFDMKTLATELHAAVTADA